MTTRMLIDARHPEETRVAVANGTRIDEFDFESAKRAQIKGNIYLAKVTRVEPSLQAAFIEYGGNRHGFLAFSEIHPDYYQIPKADREALLAEERAVAQEHADDLDEEQPHEGSVGDDGSETADQDDGDGDDAHEEAGRDDDHNDSANAEALRKKRQNLRKRYKIQEVIKRRQVLLVQVVKEERGNKGAAMTTYLSLAGRYSVLMPNTSHGGGISRKIASAADRKRLKSIVAELDLPTGMGVIVRTAGASRTKTEVKRDFDYLSRLWDGIRKKTLESAAPALIHEDSDLIRRAIRDLYTREIDEVLVDGEAGHKDAKGFMKLLMPSHAKKVKQYDDPVPIFQRYRVEEQLAEMYQPEVRLKSGGSIVINPTEALVSIDINSGKSTREHSIEDTAYKTNVEAAREIARQLKLRDMSGLIVIDFIDMDVNGNVRKVEKALKEALKDDRARIQVGRISQFGLMEMSRQRLRTGVLEASTQVCPTCHGAGIVRTTESAGLGALRLVEAAALKGKNSEFALHMPAETAIYLLNEKRKSLANLEQRYGISVAVCPEADMHPGEIDMEAHGGPPTPTVDITKPDVGDEPEEDDEEVVLDEDDEDDERGGRNRRGGRGRRGRDEESGRGGRRRRGGRNRRGRGARDDDPHEDDDAEAATDAGQKTGEGGRDEDEPSPRGRRRRGGRGRKRSDAPNTADETADTEPDVVEADAADGEIDKADKAAGADDDDGRGRRRRGRRGGRGRGRRAAATDTDQDDEAVDGEDAADASDADAESKPAKRSTSRSRKAKPAEDRDEATPVADDDADAAKAPKRRPRKASSKAPSKAASDVVPDGADAASSADTNMSAAAKVETDAPDAAAAKIVATAPAAATPVADPAATDQGGDDQGETADTGPKRRGWWQRTFGG
ncbi:MAG: ribonuclease E/G [Pseudomonadota bacterium]